MGQEALQEGPKKSLLHKHDAAVAEVLRQVPLLLQRPEAVERQVKLHAAPKKFALHLQLATLLAKVHVPREWQTPADVEGHVAEHELPKKF